MITLEQYFGIHKDFTDLTAERIVNAKVLLDNCAGLEEEMRKSGVVFKINPKTKSQISGETFGGFRPQSCPIGAPNSNHKLGKAVDYYDPDGKIDAWCMAHLDRLEAHNIWLEHPDDTPTWSHWQSVAPKSGRRVFKP